MPLQLNVDTFRNLAETSWFSSRHIVVEGPEGSQQAKLGNLVFSSGTKINNDTFAAFKAALEDEYGVFGTHAFDTVLGTRQQLHKSLRASDVKATLSRLDTIKEQRFVAEMRRLLETDPTVRELSADVRAKLFQILNEHPRGDPPVPLGPCKSQEQLTALVSKTLGAAITSAMLEVADAHGDVRSVPLDARHHVEAEVAADEPTGLRNFSATAVFKGSATSVEDRIRSGELGAGMRVNRSLTNPVLFQKLKTNGVEPGFIARNDWSVDDTRGLMADLWSDDNQRDLDDAISRSQTLRNRQLGNPPPPATRFELALLAGRAHKAGVAAVAEFVLQRELAKPDSAIAKAFAQKCPGIDPATLFPTDGSEPTQIQKDKIATVKRALFIEIRDAVMNEPADSPDYGKSPIFKHFGDRNIVKLDYNESDRRVHWDKTHKGHFRLPQRINVKNGRVRGTFYRTVRLTTADKASTGAVREALANDLTRLLGVPAQELSLVRGEYSDGHPKFMLSAKFASGYKDLEDGYLKDGQAVPSDPNEEIEPLGRYKAIFLALGDRDTIGSHGQNKGIRNGRFFAIDPGHSLEDKGKRLAIQDDLSFYEKGTIAEKGVRTLFHNFSVFDDDSRFNKFQGVLKLRELSTSPKLTELFGKYRETFRLNEPNISDAEKKLRKDILKEIDKMEAEFTAQINTILQVFQPQIDLYTALEPRGAGTQEKAIETISNLEKLTSPTTWMSPHGEVELKHLAILPDKRIPWQAAVRPDGNLVYSTKGPLDDEAKNRLSDFCKEGGVICSYDADGGASIAVPIGASGRFFNAMSEDSIAQAKHTGEYIARFVLP